MSSKWACSVVTRPPEGSSISFRHNLRLCLVHHLETNNGHLETSGASYGSASKVAQSPSADAGAPINMVDNFCEFLQLAGAPIDTVDQYRKFLNYSKKSQSNYSGQRRSSHPSISNGRKNIANHTRFDYQCLSPACGSYGNRVAVYLKPRSINNMDMQSGQSSGSALSHPPNEQVSDPPFIPEEEQSPVFFDELGQLLNVDCISTAAADQDVVDISHAASCKVSALCAVLDTGAKANVAGSIFLKRYLREFPFTKIKPPSSKYLRWEMVCTLQLAQFAFLCMTRVFLYRLK